MNEQTIAIGEGSNEGSDFGSPAAGAVDPSSIRRISELGAPTSQAPKMQPLPELFGEPQQRQQPPQQRQQQPQQRQQPAEPGLSADEQLEMEQQLLGQQDEQQTEQLGDEQPPNTEGQLTEQQAAAAYREMLDEPELNMELLGEKVMWFDSDGKGEMVPIRLRDIPGNILMFRDYQRKTAELGARNREIDARDNGRKAWVQDIVSGDATRALRALRAVGADKTTMRALTMAFVQEQAELEGMTPAMRQRFIDQQAADDRAYFAEQRAAQLQQMLEQRERQELQEQGVDSPAVTHVQQTIHDALPSIRQELKISDAEFNSDAFQYNFEIIFKNAATGKRNQDGTWAEPPLLQLGRTPSKALISRLVLESKQATDKLLQKHGRKVKGPKVPPPPTFRGSGPAAAPGQRGNLNAPQRMRFSDLGKPTPLNNGR